MKHRKFNFKFVLIILLFAGLLTHSCKKTEDEVPEVPEIPEVPPEETDEISDEQIMDTVQEATFKYFWDFGHPVSGLSRERNATYSLNTVTTGGSGFGIMAIIAGVHRGYVTREEALDRIIKMSNFLNEADRFHGVWPHWMHGETGEVIPFSTRDNGGDLVETAFLVQGLLTAREYFDADTEKETALRDTITKMWEEVEWDWHTNGSTRGLLWHWSPDLYFAINHLIGSFNECHIVYILALASPTHAIDPQVYYNGWANSGYSDRLDPEGHRALGGPLFFTHYSYLGLTPYITDEFVRAANYSSYFERHKKQTELNRQWCSNSSLYGYYNSDCWGLTASDGPPDRGYSAHAPSDDRDDGTITPSAGISSIVYTPTESLKLMKNLLKTYGESGLWGRYGFTDAFNIHENNWFATSYLAIDQGPIVVMIENYRSGLLWEMFMKNEEIDVALEAARITRTN